MLEYPGGHDERHSVVGLEGDGALKQHLSFRIAGGFRIIDFWEGLEIKVVRRKALWRSLPRPFNLGTHDLRCHDAYDVLNDLILYGKNIFGETIEGLRPDMCSCDSVEQLSGDAKTAIAASNAALQNVTHAQFTRGDAHVNGDRKS